MIEGVKKAIKVVFVGVVLGVASLGVVTAQIPPSMPCGTPFSGDVCGRECGGWWVAKATTGTRDSPAS